MLSSLLILNGSLLKTREMLINTLKIYDKKLKVKILLRFVYSRVK